jgi:hypothetical protein
MCETCPVPDAGSPRISAAAKLHAAVIALVIIGSLVAVAAGGGDQAPSGQERSAQAAGSPRLVELARQKAREDRRLGARLPASGAAAPGARLPADDRAIQRAFRRHVAEDRIIARIALASASSAGTRRAAAAVLRGSRDWTARLRPPGP